MKGFAHLGSDRPRICRRAPGSRCSPATDRKPPLGTEAFSTRVALYRKPERFRPGLPARGTEGERDETLATRLKVRETHFPQLPVMIIPRERSRGVTASLRRTRCFAVLFSLAMQQPPCHFYKCSLNINVENV